MRSHNAIHPLCIKASFETKGCRSRLPQAGRPAPTPVAAAPTHGDNHTSAGQPPPCLSGTIRWYRQNGAAVCDPVSQMAGEPECSTAHATRQDFCKRRLFVVPRQRGRMRNPFFCPAELHGLFEYLGFHRLFAQKALEFANLLIGGSEFGGRHHFLARCNSRQ